MKFVNHPTIRTIKQNFNIIHKFSFQFVSVKDNSNKSAGGDIPANILKDCKFIFSVLASCINTSLLSKVLERLIYKNCHTILRDS